MNLVNQIFPEDVENRNYVIFVTMCTCQQHDFSLVTFDTHTKNRVCKHCIEIDDMLTFLEKPPKFVKKQAKGIVFDNYCLQDANKIIDYDLRQKIIAKLLHHQIPFRFVANEIFNAMSMLIGTNIVLKNDETLLQVYVYKNEVKVYELSRREWGYFVSGKRILEIKEGTAKDEIRSKILDGFANPKHILSTWMECSGNALMKDVRAALKNKRLIVLGIHVNAFTFETSLEILKHLYDNNENKWHLRSEYLDYIGITDFEQVASDEDIILATEEHRQLPFVETKIVSRFTKNFYLAVKDEVTKEYGCLEDSYFVRDNCHRIQLSLSVDINTYPSITHEPIFLPEVEYMPRRLSPDQTEKLPVIGFFDNSSVICLWNDTENCYKFSKLWKGMFGKDLFIDFMGAKPTFVDYSEDVTSLAAAVYDIIKLLSLHPDDIKMEHHWGFNIVKDDENKILIEFETQEGIIQAATPAYLMAIMLKEHIKFMKTETGKLHTRIGFCLLNDYSENLEIKNRIEIGLGEACKHLKIESFMVERKI